MTIEELLRATNTPCEACGELKRGQDSCFNHRNFAFHARMAQQKEEHEVYQFRMEAIEAKKEALTGTILKAMYDGEQVAAMQLELQCLQEDALALEAEELGRNYVHQPLARNLFKQEEAFQAPSSGTAKEHSE